jgi:hypothetical protein
MLKLEQSYVQLDADRLNSAAGLSATQKKKSSKFVFHLAATVIERASNVASSPTPNRVSRANPRLKRNLF